MLLLDRSFLIAFEEEVAADRPAAATAVLAAHHSMPLAISIVALGEFASAISGSAPP